MISGTPKYDTAATPEPVIALESVSKWFGNVVALSDISFSIGSGVTGLLGPNGAGKTTLLRLMSGLSYPSEGKVRLLGKDPRQDYAVYSRIGIMSEHESAYEFMTGRQYVSLAAKLKNVAHQEGHIKRSIETVDMVFAQDRKIATYSRGMRQRIRLAASLVGQPDLLLLDEPLNGADPKQRISFHETIRELASAGCSIIISSHILEEVEEVCDNVLLIINGKLAAEGDYHAIRAALDDRPYRIRIVCSEPRLMGSQLAKMPDIDSIEFEADEASCIVLSSNVGVLQSALPYIAQNHHIRLNRVEPIDDSLESVFEYLVDN